MSKFCDIESAVNELYSATRELAPRRVKVYKQWGTRARGIGVYLGDADGKLLSNAILPLPFEVRAAVARRVYDQMAEFGVREGNVNLSLNRPAVLLEYRGPNA